MDTVTSIMAKDVNGKTESRLRHKMSYTFVIWLNLAKLLNCNSGIFVPLIQRLILISYANRYLSRR